MLIEAVNKQIMRDVLNSCTARNQCIVAMEELTELTQAIAKSLRGHKSIRDNLTEEIADVLISVCYIQEVFDISDTEVETFIKYKQGRTLERIERGEK